MALMPTFLQHNLLKPGIFQLVSSAGLKNVQRPPNYDHIVLPEKTKMAYVEKVPQFINLMKTPRTHKHLDLLRGPEEVHNSLIHKQYGIVAMAGGRMNYRHFEMIRFAINRKMDSKKMFAVWRVDDPWLPVTKKGLGHRMGGGKSSIDHYVTPVRKGRIIFEVGGKAAYEDAYFFLRSIALRMPFTCIPCNEDILNKMKLDEEREKTDNINPYTMEWLIKNNVGNCRRWLRSKTDFKYFGKHL